MAAELYSKRSIKRKFLGLRNERPKAEPGQALVLTGSGGSIVLYPGQQTTSGEAVWGAYDTIYEVDMGRRDIRCQCNAPAKGGDVSFLVDLSAGYRVSKPAEVVDQRITDPDSLLQRVLAERISRITANFDIEDGASALDAVRANLADEKLGAKVPFDLDTIRVSLELDNEAKAYLKQRREQRRQAELARSSSDLTVATAQADQLRQQYDLDAQRRQREFELELDKQRVESELNIQKMRIEVYKPMIEGGMWAVLVQQLAQNPDDISQVTNLILQMHSQKVTGDVQMLQTMLDNDLIEDRQLKGVTESLIQNLEVNARGGIPQVETQPADKRLTDEKSSDNEGERDEK